MFRNSEAPGVKQVKLEVVRESEGIDLTKNTAGGELATRTPSEKREESSTKDLSSFGLDGVKLVEVAERGS